MKTLVDVFSSKAKFKLLSTLYTLKSGANLRFLSELSQINLRSAQLALKHLKQNNLVRVKTRANETHYTLNSTHDLYEPLTAVFDALRAYELKQTRNICKQKADTVFEFIDQTQNLVRTKQ